MLTFACTVMSIRLLGASSKHRILPSPPWPARRRRRRAPAIGQALLLGLHVEPLALQGSATLRRIVAARHRPRLPGAKAAAPVKLLGAVHPLLPRAQIVALAALDDAELALLLQIERGHALAIGALIALQLQPARSRPLLGRRRAERREQATEAAAYAQHRGRERTHPVQNGFSVA
jgi:hypothetical protein